MKKFLNSILLFILVLLTGCSGTNTMIVEGDIKGVYLIAEKLIDELNFSFLHIMSEETEKQDYTIKNFNFDEYIIYTSNNNLVSDEMAIYKVKDEDTKNKLIKLLKERKSFLIKKWINENEDEYFKIRESKILVKGEYLMYIVTKDITKAEIKFNQIVDEIEKKSSKN